MSVSSQKYQHDNITTFPNFQKCSPVSSLVLKNTEHNVQLLLHGLQDHVTNYRQFVWLYHVVTDLHNYQKANNDFHFIVSVVKTEQCSQKLIVALITTNKNTVSKFKTFDFTILSYTLMLFQIFIMKFLYCLEKSIDSSPFSYKVMRSYQNILIF